MKKDTKLVHGGRHPEQQFGAVNPPVYHASTITYPNLAAWMEARGDRYNRVIYGRFGTPTTKALEEAMALAENTDRCMALASGYAACSASVMSVAESGAHLLVQDSAYFPVRNLCEKFLPRFGVRTTFFDPSIGEDIVKLIEPETKLIYLEAPGSLTFEMPDVPAITAIARERGIRTAIDNTWATPHYFRPADHGVDLSINACTKYIVGHSDAMLGTVALSDDLFSHVRDTANFSGNCAGSDEVYLGLRGLRTLSVRLERHARNALQAAEWFQRQPEVARVLYPALPDDPGHALWQRDFDGATGLFTVCFNALDEKQVEALVDNLDLFGLGASWGGYECLVLPFDARPQRTATEWAPTGPTIRFHIGLDDAEDILADLEKGFAHMRKI